MNKRNKDIKESVIHTLIEIKFDHANKNDHIYNILTAKIIKYKICIHLFHPNKNYNSYPPAVVFGMSVRNSK
jgi:hypothetical protein